VAWVSSRHIAPVESGRQGCDEQIAHDAVRSSPQDGSRSPATLVPMVRSGGRDRSERLVAINRTRWPQSRDARTGALTHAGRSMRDPRGASLAGVVATVPMQCGPRNEIRTFDLSRRRGGVRSSSRTVSGYYIAWPEQAFKRLLARLLKA